MASDPSLTLSRRDLLVVGVASMAVACGPDERPGVNAMGLDAPGVGDASPEVSPVDDAAIDAAPVDSVGLDGGLPDATSPDVAASDASVDASTADADGSDVSVADASVSDVDLTDVAVPDAPAPDVGLPEASVTDVAESDVDSPVDVAPPDVMSCVPASARRLGALREFPVHRWVAVLAARVIVGRDARGIFAYTSECTHSGCDVPEPASAKASSVCPCHGATYTSDGEVTGGPAPRSLVNYAVVVCDGDVYVDTSRIVPMGTRTPAM